MSLVNQSLTFGAGDTVHNIRLSRCSLGIRRLDQHRIIRMGFDMLLEILRSLERFSTKVAFMWLERDVDTDMRCDMVALYDGSPTTTPVAG